MLLYYQAARSGMLKNIARGDLKLSARLFSQLKWQGSITCNGRPVRARDWIECGDRLCFSLPEGEGCSSENPVRPGCKAAATLKPNPSLARKIPILYRDGQTVVFHKPAGIPVHPSSGHWDGDTLGNAFAAIYPGLPFRPVYRLDKDTSGICIAALNPHAACQMAEHSRHRETLLYKTYYAIVCGRMEGSGVIDAPMVREGTEARIRRVASGSEECSDLPVMSAVTHWTSCHTQMVKGHCYTLLRVWLETGRTHQIRVHMAYIGRPLAGDRLYGGDQEASLCSFDLLKRHGLHCGEVIFTPPGQRDVAVCTCPLPADMRFFLSGGI